eukprot:313428-Pleurochrysis_carterae.AAC.1
MTVQLLSIKRSSVNPYKYTAILRLSSGSLKTTHFGHRDYEDYTLHKDLERRERYMRRHQKDLETGDPTRAGFLSMFILWNKPTLEGSIRDYIRRLRVYNKTGVYPTD